MSVLLTRSDVEGVVRALRPSIELFLERFAKRQDLAILVLDPASANEPVPLYSLNLGNPDDWEYNYEYYAAGKAAVCLREKCDSDRVKSERPFRYQPGDPPYAGGVYVEGLVVACSGVEGYFDQMIAHWIAAGCRAIATHRFQKEVIDQDLDAIPVGS